MSGCVHFAAWAVGFIVTIIAMGIWCAWRVCTAYDAGFRAGRDSAEVVNRWQSDVRVFHLLSEQPAPTKIDFSEWPGEMRLALIFEEAEEIRDGWLAMCRARTSAERVAAEAEIVDGLVDLAYVTVGAAVSAGVNLQPFWELIARANLTKVDGSIGPKRYRADGKLLKPEGWKHPDVLALLRALKEQES